MVRCKYMNPTGVKDKWNYGMVDKVLEYYEECLSNTEAIPFIEELALQKLGVDDETVWKWGKRYPRMNNALKKVKKLQRMRLEQIALSKLKGNPIGAIFLLKTNHGYVETEKKQLVGTDNEPLMIKVIAEAIESKPKLTDGE